MNEFYATVGAVRWLPTLVRLWLLRPLDSLPRAHQTRAVSVLASASLLLWAAIDRWQSRPAPSFDPSGIPLLAWYALAVLTLAALLRRLARGAGADAPLVALVLGGLPVLLLFTGVAVFYLEGVLRAAGYFLLALYLWAYFARGLRAACGGARPLTAGAAVLFLALTGYASDRLDAIPDVWVPRQSEPSAPADAPDAEALLFSQPERIDTALEAVQRGSRAGSQAFFVGFAGVADQRVFAQEIGLAAQVLGERYGIGRRELLLLNDQRDLTSAPLATVAGLKYALKGIAARMDLERDVLFLSLSSHGGKDATLEVSNAELPLDQLTDEDLAEALSDSGIKWRVIVISACYAGSFIESLRDPHTIVISAAAADRTSFGCSSDADLTYFGEAFYRDALPHSASLRAAFELAKSAVAAREKREGVSASEPQAFFGAQIEAKLATLAGD